jgi:hypothetical protein
VDEKNAEMDRLLRDLQDADRTLDAVYMKETADWRIGLGDIRIRGNFPSNSIAVIFVAFNAVLFALGIFFSLLGGTLNSLGVSLIVGSLFAASAFVAQFWAVSYQRGVEVYREIFGDGLGELRDLASKRAEILEKIRTITDSADPKVQSSANQEAQNNELCFGDIRA